MGALDELYQNVILDHNRAPRNYRELPDATGRADGVNPLCGDAFTVWVRVDDDRIAEATFQGKGCAISKASASLMTQAVGGKTTAEALALFERFHELVTGTLDQAVPRDTLGKLAVFGGVSEYPMRVKCASLAWHAMRAALTDTAAITTE